MEHRYAERFALDLAATLIQDDARVATGIIRNGSRYGLFIETDFKKISLLQKLRIEIVLHPLPQQSVHYTLNGRVIRKTNAGLGLELETIGGEDSRVIKALITVIGETESVRIRDRRRALP